MRRDSAVRGLQDERRRLQLLRPAADAPVPAQRGNLRLRLHPHRGVSKSHKPYNKQKRAAQKGGPFRVSGNLSARAPGRGSGAWALPTRFFSRCAAFNPYPASFWKEHRDVQQKLSLGSLFYFWGTRRSKHSRYFSWVLATTSAGSWGAGVTPSSLFSMSQSRRYCLS